MKEQVERQTFANRSSDWWLIGLLAAWMFFSTALALALFRQAIPAAWKDILLLVSSVMVVGTIPLAWLRLNDELHRLTRELVARLLGHWIGPSILLTLLLAAGTYLLSTALQMRQLSFFCEPIGLQLFVDGQSESAACLNGAWVATGSKLVALASDHNSWSHVVTSEDSVISVRMSRKAVESDWICRIRKLDERSGSLANCPSGGTWTRAAFYSLQVRRRRGPLPSVDFTVRGRRGFGFDLQDQLHQCAPSDDEGKTPLLRMHMTEDCIGARSSFDAILTVCMDDAAPGVAELSRRPTWEMFDILANETEDRDLGCR